MPDILRTIAVHVDEPEPLAFFWVLTERSGSGASARWVELQRARTATDRYQPAMAAGLEALQALVDDLDIGPRRAAGAASSEAPPDPAPDDTADAPPTARPKAGSLFGFGPAR